jgi:hypothetical protein
MHVLLYKLKSYRKSFDTYPWNLREAFLGEKYHFPKDNYILIKGNG